MSISSGFERLALRNIAQRCAEESELFFHHHSHDPRFCFELFRRAIMEHVQDAWELIYTQYKSLVAGWVNRHPAFPNTGEDAAYFVNRSFERMWVALTPEKFIHFPDLKSVLRYLQMCVHSVIIDHTRVSEWTVVETPLGDQEIDLKTEATIVEEQTTFYMQRREFWESLTSRLHDEKERYMIYGSFVLDLKPQELQAVYKDTFQSVDDVYRVKQNVLDRLRRDPELLKLLALDD